MVVFIKVGHKRKSNGLTCIEDVEDHKPFLIDTIGRIVIKTVAGSDISDFPVMKIDSLKLLASCPLKSLGFSDIHPVDQNIPFDQQEDQKKPEDE